MGEAKLYRKQSGKPRAKITFQIIATLASAGIATSFSYWDKTAKKIPGFSPMFG